MAHERHGTRMAAGNSQREQRPPGGPSHMQVVTASEAPPLTHNLIERPWIPVLQRDGQLCRVGIRQALAQAGEYRQLAASNPIDNVAVFRLLLAVLLWCKPHRSDDESTVSIPRTGIPREWLTPLGPPGNPSPVFDLLDAKTPFYQDPSVASAKPIAATYLLHELPSGTNIAHFRHTRDGRDGLCLICCGMGLVRWSCVASAGTAGGGESMTAGLNGQTPAYTIRVGATLLESLSASAQGRPRVEGDVPVWEGATETSPLGTLKGLTWRSRRMLLVVPERSNPPSGAEHCCYCGAKTDHLVTKVHFRPGWDKPRKEPWSEDPHLLRITPARKKPTTRGTRTITPVWPSPNSPLELHAGVWLPVLEGLIQRAAGDSSTAGTFCTCLISASKALYKHFGMHLVVLPALSPNAARVLLDEMLWLRTHTWRTHSGQTNRWANPPRGSVTVEALCARRAKGQAIRSQLCAASVACEQDIETAFVQLTHSLARSERSDAALIEGWRDRVSRTVRQRARQVVTASVPGSPLRRQEALMNVDAALIQARTRPQQSPRNADEMGRAGQ